MVSNSPRLATCASQASPTCLLPCWAIKTAWRKERLDEYSIKRCAGILRVAASRSCCHVCDSADVLVGDARIVGEPFDLYRTAGRRRYRDVGFLDQLGGPAAHRA